MAERYAVLLGGTMASGKTTVANGLAHRLGIERLSFGSLVRSEAKRLGLGSDRRELQDLGLKMHSDLGADGLVNLLLAGRDSSFIIDGVRHMDVLAALEGRFDESLFVLLTANESTIASRWSERSEAVTRSAASDHKVESELNQLRSRADLSVNTGRRSADIVVSTVVAFLSKPTSTM